MSDDERYQTVTSFRDSRRRPNQRVAVVSAPAYGGYVTDKPPGNDLSINVGHPINPYQPATPAPTQNPNVKIDLTGVYDPTYFSQFANIPINVGPVDVVALQATDSLRTYLFILNTGSVTIYFAFGRQATLSDIPLASGGGGFFEWNVRIPQNDLHVISASASKLAMMYGTKAI